MLNRCVERSAPTAPLYRVALVLLCAAYLQGPLTKLADFNGAMAEMAHFGLHPPGLMAILVIGFELLASAMIILGFGRRIAAMALAAFTFAATLLALRFWEVPAGPARMGAMNAFFEHLGLIGGFMVVILKETAGNTLAGKSSSQGPASGYLKRQYPTQGV